MPNRSLFLLTALSALVVTQWLMFSDYVLPFIDGIVMINLHL